MKANGVQGEAQPSQRSTSRVSDRLRAGLSIHLRLSIAAVLIFFTCQNSARAQLTILHNFGDGTVANDGAHATSVIQAPDGTFFGTTANQAKAPSEPAGTIFLISPSGALQIIHTFGLKSVLQPSCLLYRRGTLIGTTILGPSPTGSGTIFSLKKSTTTSGWRFRFLYKFASADFNTWANVIFSGGDYFGTTPLGGTNLGGTVFKFDPATDQLTTFYNFSPSYYQPIAGLVKGGDGNFYGSTTVATASGYPESAFFKLTPSGQATFYQPNFVLHVISPLIQASDGNFYGIGAANNLVTTVCVFSLTPSGVFGLLHVFGQGTDGTNPTGTVVQGPDGNLYGVTSAGGTAGQGILFMVSTDGKTYNILHNFGDGSVPNDGLSPQGTPIFGQDKNLYGTTSNGGSAGLGTVFKFSLTP